MRFILYSTEDEKEDGGEQTPVFNVTMDNLYVALDSRDVTLRAFNHGDGWIDFRRSYLGIANWNSSGSLLVASGGSDCAIMGHGRDRGRGDEAMADQRGHCDVNIVEGEVQLLLSSNMKMIRISLRRLRRTILVVFRSPIAPSPTLHVQNHASLRLALRVSRFSGPFADSGLCQGRREQPMLGMNPYITSLSSAPVVLPSAFTRLLFSLLSSVLSILPSGSLASSATK
ncbi:hypothetical protein BD410DRAFT_903156 [Rickenella mellea]|uniref:Uncharacterized protein n=1 Tax=Rickenella mellea TaxID=50990 RepID=A0A4Y7PHZ2_9AGAM|nr:hypothetical protein BD410DRAFT_903156 [Rickenella mellea]